MGLHLCFELHLPDTCPEVDVADTLRRLRDKAVALPFEAVTSLIQLSGDALGDDLRVGGAITEHRRFEDLEME